MELDWLETFLAVVDRGGFTAASEQLHRSQSRVSAHIAALERDLGVRLIDRSRRPAALTTAGEVFARHARDVVTGVGAARSAVGSLRGMDAKPVSVLTTPCIGAALFPVVLAELVERHPGVRLALSEQSWHDVERRFLADSVAVAVLPRLSAPLPPGLHEQMLWRERIRVVVAPDHELAAAGRAVPPEELVRCPLIVCGSSTDVVPEVLAQLAELGLAGQPRAAVDSPHTVLAMARAGAGVGVLNAVALEAGDTHGLVVLDIDDPRLARDVAAYWYPVLAGIGPAMELHRIVLDAPVPAGAIAAPRSDPPARANGWSPARKGISGPARR